jgi:hypothetical protein
MNAADETYLVPLKTLADADLDAMQEACERSATKHPRLRPFLEILVAAISGERERRAGRLPGYRGLLVPSLEGDALLGALQVCSGQALGAGVAQRERPIDFYEAVHDCLIAASTGGAGPMVQH